MRRTTTFLFTLLIAIFCGTFANATDQSKTRFAPEANRSIKNDVTIPFREMKPKPIKQGKPEAEAHEVINRVLPKALNSIGKKGLTSPLRSVPATKTMPATFENFEGTDNLCGCLPPDTNGDVGPANYVQVVNTHIQIFDKQGTSLLGPEPISTLWQGFGGVCEDQDSGDPIALYDQLADRWLISQFALFGPGGHNHQCIAISQTPDPTGAYFRYDFDLGTLVNDYPHLGVWPDGYYMSVNQFTGSFAWAGAGVYAFERDKMLAGQSAQKVYFNLFSEDPNFGGMLPSDLDGPAPNAGDPNVFAEMDDDAFGVPTDRISLWDFHVDWTTPANSTFGVGGQPTTHVDTAPFDTDMCGFSRSCIDQPGTSTGLDAISDRLMHRLQYRNFGGYATIVGNHTVDADGNDRAGVDWFSLRNDGSGWVMNDQGIYAPADGDSRWMGSAAMDSAGNIVIGFSVSGASTFPSIRYAGRLVSDPAGEMSQGEGTIIAGTGNQTHPLARWGDYSGISVDPSPGQFGGIDCDFWYTTEYIETSGSANWQTRVGAFSFAPGACGGPHGDLDGTITDASTTDPISGAKVQVQPGGFSTTTDVNGHYHLTLSAVPGIYDVTASSYGYFSQTQASVQVTDGGVTVKDFALNLAPHVFVNGTVTDGSGHGWPLYARIDITGYPLGPIFTNPYNGTYSVELIQDTPYTFNVHAISPGYITGVRAVTPPSGGSTENFALLMDGDACNAPGYGITTGVAENFDSGVKPPTWTVVDNIGNGEEWSFTDPESQPNNTGGTGLFAVINSDFYGPGEEQDTELVSPVLNFSGTATVHLSFDTDFFYFGDPPETADVDVSTNGGSTWTNVLRYEDGDVRGPHHEDLDISSIAGNQSNVKVRFHYYNAIYEFWWQVDNVKVGAVCSSVPGGLILGNVYDGNTNAGLNGAKVSSNNAPSEKTTTFSTPIDTNVDEGFFILFSSLTGSNPFTASKNSYGSDTEAVNVASNLIVQQNFHLAAGKIEPDPLLLEDTVDLGTSDVAPLTLNNTGGASADFELQEGKGNTAAPQAGAKGAPLIHRLGHFSPLRMGAPSRPTKVVPGEADKDDVGPVVPGPKVAPWTAIASYPTSIMDNTCAEMDGKIYCVGGFDGADNTNAGQVYDPAGDSWTAIASMSDVREKPAAASIDGKLYVVGGWDSNGTPDTNLEIYDPVADSWSTGASIPTAFAASTAVNLDGKLYIIGGCDSGDCGFTAVQVYDPVADSWTTAADYPEPISWNACGASGGLIYCAGGVASGESQHTYSYDPGADAWTQLADMPQTQWAMGYTISDDQLYISGGVTANFTAVTNEGFVYDPGSDAWTAIENSNNTLYRGGSACGLYRIGGSSGGFNPVPDSEVYPGLTNCGGVVDVPWLSENPTTGTIAANDSQGINVTFDASQVTQPGDYLAHLRIKENTPYTTPDVQVVMHVPLPADWGYLAGTVNGLARCDQPGSPLNKATVFVDTNGTDYTLTTDANGNYLIAFPIADGPASITASKNGYITKSVSGIAINHASTTTQNFDLRLDAACIDVESIPPNDPPLLEATVNLGAVDNSLQFTMLNTGAADADFELLEGNGNTSAPEQKTSMPVMRVKGQFTPLSFLSKNRFKSANPPVAPKVAPWVAIANYPSAIMDNTCAEISGLVYCVGGFDGGDVSKAGKVYDPGSNSWAPIADMADAREKPAVAAIDGKLYVIGGWDSNGTPDGKLEIYDPSGNSWSTGTSNPSPFAASTAVNLDGKLYVIGGCDSADCGFKKVQVYDPSGNSWSTAADYPEPTSWNACGAIAGSIYCAGGVASNESKHTYSYDSGADAWTPLADMPQTQWAMGFVASDDKLFVSGGVTDNFNTVTNEGFAYDPTANSWAPIENSNNSLYRGGSACGLYKVGGSSGGFNPVKSAEVYPGLTNCGASVDVLWLSENPTTGNLPADSTPGNETTIDVTFDATQVNQPGDYMAHVKIKTSYGIPNVNALMHVPLPAGWGYLDGTVKGDLRCDLPGNPLNNATVFVHPHNGPSDFTLKTDANGYYKVAFVAGLVDITVSKNGYIQQAVTNVNIGIGEVGSNPPQNFDLRLDAPCIDVQSVPVNDPPLLEATVDLGASNNTLQFNMTNTGAGDADFELKEGAGNTAAPQLVGKNAHPASGVRVGKSHRNNKRSNHHATKLSMKAPSPQSSVRTTKGLQLRSPQQSHPYPKTAGDVIQSWSPSSFSWGIAIDGGSQNVWVDSPSSGWGGDDMIVEYQSDGTATGTSWPHSWGPSFGPADATYNRNTGTIWSMDVAGDNCIHEIDPASGVTGNTICPSFGDSQRGIAYDPETDTYYAGGWNEGIIYHFDPSGTILDSQNVSLSISGLAYNPDTQHLFVMVNDSPNTIHVLDAADSYTDLGEISIDGFNDFDGAGLEIGCDGSLWAVNQTSNTVFQVDSGETTSVCGGDLPWLSEVPDSGNLAPDQTFPGQSIDVTFDAAQVNQPGDYLGHIKIKTSYTIPDVQAIMHVPLPPDWGYLEGTVNGLARCDQPGAPLNKATVFVDTGNTTYTLSTDASGHYLVAFPIADGPNTTITASANGYVTMMSSGVALDHNVHAVLDFDLRLDAPCADKSPTSFAADLGSDATLTVPLTLLNTGAGTLNYTIRETAFPLNPLRPHLRKAIVPKVTASANAPGPQSVLSQKSQKGKSSMPVPSDAWFSALPVPGGLVRYGHAQCDTQPNSYYVISGVDGSFSTTNKTWRFDADTNTWNKLAPIPLAAEGSTATCYQGRIYVLGGSSDGANGGTQFYVYDIATNTWFSGADLPRQVWGAASASWNGQLYLIGGNLDFSGSGTSAEVDIYDIATDTWTGAGSDMPVAAAASGFVQAANNLYIAGGWDDASAPDSNIVAVQRYDMATDTWTAGPDLPSGRADLALAITDTALYAMGGDDDGGSFFDSTTGVTRLAWAGWPGGSWTQLTPALPSALTSNNAGFCTMAIAAGSEIWSLGGLDTDFNIQGTNTFRTSQTEHCFSIFSDVPWLSESPDSGSVSPDSNGTVDVTFDTTGLIAGDYNAVLVVSTNDFGATQFNIPVTLHVGLFHDDFNDGDYTTPEWTVTGPTGAWDASSGDLVGSSSKRMDAYSPAFGNGGCRKCTIVANITVNTSGENLSLFGWFGDKKNNIELRLLTGKAKVLFKQKANGTTVAKQSQKVDLPEGDYTVQMSYEGADFHIDITGQSTASFIVHQGAVPKGTVAFRVKPTSAAPVATGTLREIGVF